MKTPTILGISAGTRSVGFVVVKGGEVVDWHIKSFKQAWSKEKLGMIIEAIEKVIVSHDVAAIVIKSPCELRLSRNIKLLVAEYERMVKRKGITTYRYNLDELKQSSKEIVIRNKHHLMKYVAGLYPCMYNLFKKELQNRNPYHFRVFEALFAVHYFVTCCKGKKE